MDKLLDAIAAALELPEVAPDACAGNPVEWDSLGHLHVVIEIEASFGVTFRTALVPTLTSVAALAEALRAEGVEL